MRLVLFEPDPSYQRSCELLNSGRLISLHGANPLIPIQPGWDSAWLLVGLPWSILLPRWTRTKQPTAPGEISQNAWRGGATSRLSLNLHINGFCPPRRGWGGRRRGQERPFSFLIRVQLPEAVSRQVKYRLHLQAVGISIKGYVQAVVPKHSASDTSPVSHRGQSVELSGLSTPFLARGG